MLAIPAVSADADTVAYWQFDNSNTNTTPTAAAFADAVGTYDLSVTNGGGLAVASGVPGG